MRLLNKNTARRAAAAAALLTMTAAMSVGAFAADAEDATVAGYLPPQSSEVMVQGDIALHSDVPVGEVDPNYGGYASPVENPIQGNVMMISDDGTIIRMAAADVNVYSRTAQGVRVMRVSEGTKVISLARVPQEEDKNQTEEAAEEATEPADAPAEAPASAPQEETP